MNKLSALDSYKVSVILEGQLEKLSYLDALKSNMGDEMAEMMSQEITRVMEQQRHLEKEYARLVTLRSELKGLSNKHKLQDIRQEILVSSNLPHDCTFSMHVFNSGPCRKSPRSSRTRPALCAVSSRTTLMSMATRGRSSKTRMT